MVFLDSGELELYQYKSTLIILQYYTIHDTK